MERYLIHDNLHKFKQLILLCSSQKQNMLGHHNMCFKQFRYACSRYTLNIFETITSTIPPFLNPTPLTFSRIFLYNCVITK
jgi:hypothetical protein